MCESWYGTFISNPVTPVAGSPEGKEGGIVIPVMVVVNEKPLSTSGPGGAVASCITIQS